jgi:hypothetical protein
MCCPYHSTLAPIRLALAESLSPRGFNGNLMLRVHCQQAVLLRRVLLMEQQVRVCVFFFLLSLEQSLRTLHVAVPTSDIPSIDLAGLPVYTSFLGVIAP